mmetsp:Transcript_6656/g.23546  ORF Transcript_6656/g.23546 Transcript_6656/m.23546 type:complete len:500 (-) Transcript_6656:72-1571(-)
MVLTVVVGSSGSGKTTFLNHVYEVNKCIYVRQYHNLRPYVTVAQIPSFDPSKLPFWDLYATEKQTIKIGGTMAGDFTAGFSGGQRKMLLFELICQRVAGRKGMLIVFDEPFAGVTDDFVPWIVGRLEVLSQDHSVLLVTNDHIDALTTLADNTLRVSAIDRSKVAVNGALADRAHALNAVSSGKNFDGGVDGGLRFFWETEVSGSAALFGIFAFTAFAFGCFLLTFWNTSKGSEPLVMVAAQIVAYFCVNPYLLSLTDWRNYVTEESEALMHASLQTNMAMKVGLTLMLILIIAGIEYGLLQLVRPDTMYGGDYFLMMLMDSASLTLPLIAFALFTKLPLGAVQICGSMPFLFMIFFSTTFSPGAGVDAVKTLRYLFPRYYLWCRLPGVEMSACPPNDRLPLYAVITGLGFFCTFALVVAIKNSFAGAASNKRKEQRALFENDADFIRLKALLAAPEDKDAPTKAVARCFLTGGLNTRAASATAVAAAAVVPSDAEEKV